MKKTICVLLLLITVGVVGNVLSSKKPSKLNDEQTVTTLGYGNSKDLPINGETGI